MKLAQKAAKENAIAETIQTIPVVNDASEVMTDTKRILTLKKKPLPVLQVSE